MTLRPSPTRLLMIIPLVGSVAMLAIVILSMPFPGSAMLIAFCVFAFGLISLIIPARYALTVDETGITLRELTRAQFVPWSEVAGISVVSWQPTTTAGVPSGVRVLRRAAGRPMTDLYIPDIFSIHRDALAQLLQDHGLTRSGAV